MSIFSTIPINKPKRNSFNLSHERKMTCKLGKLNVMLNIPVVPGDTAKVVSEAMVRMAPMVAPIMHRVNCYIHYFYVPNRIIWSEFEEFITGGEDGTSEPAMPHITGTQISAMVRNNNYRDLFQHGSLWDFLGLPSSDDLPSSADLKISLLPFRAYQMIWNEYYRDQNLQDEVDICKDISGDGHTEAQIHDLLTLRNRCWEKDYFSGALPWPQRGEDVFLPLHGDAPVVATREISASEPLMVPFELGNGLSSSDIEFEFSGNGSLPSNNTVVARNAYSSGGLSKGPLAQYNGNDYNTILSGIEGTQYIRQDNITGNYVADLTQVTAATINELRRATAAQRYLELRARSGSRYIEVIEAEFGVRSSDARLQRPEYLGGGKTALVISEVLQNSASDETTPQGNMAGHGLSVGKTHKFKRFFEEHGYVIGIMSIVPKPTYQQGIPRDFLKMDKYDYYSPMFAHLGEQEIYNAEIYANQTNPYGLFGYTPRYAEYKYIPSSVHGDFRGNMDFWHMGRIFSNPPTLNAEFVQVDEAADDLTRVFAAMTDNDGVPYDHYWVYLYNSVKMLRPMPVFGIPKIQ